MNATCCCCWAVFLTNNSFCLALLLPIHSEGTTFRIRRLPAHPLPELVSQMCVALRKLWKGWECLRRPAWATSKAVELARIDCEMNINGWNKGRNVSRWSFVGVRATRFMLHEKAGLILTKERFCLCEISPAKMKSRGMILLVPFVKRSPCWGSYFFAC